MDIQTRKAMEFVRDHLALNETRLYEHVSSTFRWLMATLFAANGGALLGLLNAQTPLPGMMYAAGWFAVGLLFSILMGVATSFAAVKATTDMSQLVMKIEQGLIEDVEKSEEIQEYSDSHQVTWRTWFPSYLGATSLLFWIIGALTLGGSWACASA